MYRNDGHFSFCVREFGSKEDVRGDLRRQGRRKPK